MKNHWNAKKLQNETAQPTAFTKTGDVSKIPQLVEDGVLIKYMQPSDVNNVKQ